MEDNKEIIYEKIANIEDMLEEISQNTRILIKENEDNRNENLLLMTRFENLADFVKDKYNIVIEENKTYKKDV